MNMKLALTKVLQNFSFEPCKQTQVREKPISLYCFMGGFFPAEGYVYKNNNACLRFHCFVTK